MINVGENTMLGLVVGGVFALVVTGLLVFVFLRLARREGRPKPPNQRK